MPRPTVINGNIDDSSERLRLVDRFQSVAGFACLVLAPRAAGVGLNISAANHVIHYMREWNPAIESQATDRCYRIGQERPVHVHTITARSSLGVTVEERLGELLDDKRRLFSDFVLPLGDLTISQGELVGAGGWEERGGADEDRDLFSPVVWEVVQQVRAASPGLELEPPREHVEAGRVVGLDDGSVQLGGRAVVLIDATRPDAERVAAVLGRTGAVVEKVDGSDRAATAQAVLKHLARSGRS